MLLHRRGCRLPRAPAQREGNEDYDEGPDHPPPAYPDKVTGRAWILWALFLVRGTFYCTMLPLWEGWDEYAHFAWLAHWNQHGTPPRYDTPFPEEIEQSLKRTPLTEELKWLGPGHFTYEQWWARPAAERRTIPEAGRAVPPLVFYEAQQPPLYYWIAAVPERLAGPWPLRSRVLLIRLLSLLLASSVIPLAFLAAKTRLGDAEATLCAALLAAAPGLAIDTARVANDSLAIALSSLILLVLLRKGPAWLLGVVLGAALLTKAYLLSLIPAIVWLRRRKALVPVGIALVIGAWWYARNLAIGYSMSGWLDRAAPAAIAGAIGQVNWVSAANVVAKSFLWFGGWSFLTLKSWAYLVLELAGALGFAGALRTPGLAPAWSMVACHLAAITYGILVYFAAHQVGNLPGWYLWPMAAPLALLMAAGLKRWTAALVALLAVADIYGAAALMLPYYSGFVPRNRANAMHFTEALGRLNTPVWLAAAWLLATLTIVGLSARAENHKGS
jgi:4-amino-4-deoxy-L-arabinose transferase-like glycosyltransferase